jgi:hypothetical protein
MPVSFIFALIVVLVALIVLAFGKKIAHSRETNTVRDRYGNTTREATGSPLGWKRVVATVLGLFFVAGLLTLNASFNMVSVRHIGIVTSPGHKPTNEIKGAGPSFVAPWNFVDEWDANYELWDHRSDNGGKGMLVKIAGNQDAWVPVSVEYAANGDNASQDFIDYARNRDNWIARRVYPTLDNAVSGLFRTHDPLAKANIDQATGQVNPPDMTPYKNELNQKLQASGQEFTIRNLYIGTIKYSDKTTAQLQEYSNLVIQNRNLQQEKINQNVKNEITASQAKVDPLTYCLQIQEKTGTLCLLAGNGSAPVIVDGTKK